jgi:hypothetical protein
LIYPQKPGFLGGVKIWFGEKSTGRQEKKKSGFEEKTRFQISLTRDASLLGWRNPGFLSGEILDFSIQNCYTQIKWEAQYGRLQIPDHRRRHDSRRGGTRHP